MIVTRTYVKWKQLKKRRLLVLEAWLTPGNTPIPYVCYLAEFGRSRSNGTSVIKDIRLKKIVSSRPAFQGHSRNDRSAIYDILLTFHGNHEPIYRTVCEINGDFSRKSQKLPTPSF